MELGKRAIVQFGKKRLYTAIIFAIKKEPNPNYQAKYLDLIIDEAHHNSFSKLFKFFSKSFILGVTATPLSSNVEMPMTDNYNELIVGESIASLIENKFLSKAEMFTYNVGLTSLEVGANGDYTVKSSDDLYTNMAMQEKLELLIKLQMLITIFH